MRRWFHRIVLARVGVTFLWLVGSFLAFGGGTLNLFYVLRANLNLLADNGWPAVMEGGLRQLGEIIVTCAVSMLAYVVFKACEHRLVEWLSHPEQK